jgi:hypothetical protein
MRNRHIIIGIVVVLALTLTVAQASAWWDEDWNNVTNLTVYNGNTSELTDFVIRVTVDADTVVSQSQADFDDIRFINETGGTELDYWLEAKVDSEWAIFRVKFDFLPVGWTNSTFKLYYNNSGCSSNSDGDSTSWFCDDFPGSAINTTKWPTAGGTPVVSDSMVQIQNADGLTGNYAYTDFIMEAKVKYAAENGDGDFRVWVKNALAKYYGGLLWNDYTADSDTIYSGLYPNEVPHTGDTYVTTGDTWYHFRETISANYQKLEVAVYPGSSFTTLLTRSDDWSGIDLAPRLLGNAANTEGYVDWILINHYAGGTINCTLEVEEEEEEEPHPPGASAQEFWYDGHYWYKMPYWVISDDALYTDFSVNMTEDAGASQLDTAALVGAGKMQADGDDDLWVAMDETELVWGWWNETPYNTNSTLIWVNMSRVYSSQLTGASGTDNVLTVNDASGFQEEDVVFITASIENGEDVWEVNTITDIEGDQITFEDNFENNYGTNARVAYGCWRYYKYYGQSQSDHLDGFRTFDFFDDFDTATFNPGSTWVSDWYLNTGTINCWGDGALFKPEEPEYEDELWYFAWDYGDNKANIELRKVDLSTHSIISKHLLWENPAQVDYCRGITKLGDTYYMLWSRDTSSPHYLYMSSTTDEETWYEADRTLLATSNAEIRGGIYKVNETELWMYYYQYSGGVHTFNRIVYNTVTGLSAPEVVISNSGEMTYISFYGEEGTIYMYYWWQRSMLYCRTSTDGATWSAPITIKSGYYAGPEVVKLAANFYALFYMQLAGSTTPDKVYVATATAPEGPYGNDQFLHSGTATMADAWYAGDYSVIIAWCDTPAPGASFVEEWHLGSSTKPDTDLWLPGSDNFMAGVSVTNSYLQLQVSEGMGGLPYLHSTALLTVGSWNPNHFGLMSKEWVDSAGAGPLALTGWYTDNLNSHLWMFSPSTTQTFDLGIKKWEGGVSTLSTGADSEYSQETWYRWNFVKTGTTTYAIIEADSDTPKLSRAVSNWDYTQQIGVNSWSSGGDTLRWDWIFIYDKAPLGAAQPYALIGTEVENDDPLLDPPPPYGLTNTTTEPCGWCINWSWVEGESLPGDPTTDSYNVSINGTWHNGTTNTFYQACTGPHGTICIIVYSYNETTDTLSGTYISGCHTFVNNPISISGCTNMNVVPGYLVTIDLNYSDCDSDSPSYFSTNAPVGDLNTITGVYTWTPTDSDIGTHIFGFNVSDGYGSVDGCEVTIIVGYGYSTGGTVKNPYTGEGVPGAWVCVLEANVCDQTDENGTYIITGLGDGTYTVRVCHPAFTCIEEQVEITGGNLTLNFTLTNERPKANSSYKVGKLSETAYDTLMHAFGFWNMSEEGECLDAEPGIFNATAFFTAISMPYTAIFGSTFFLIFFALPILMMYLRTGYFYVPMILGVVVGGIMLAFVPAGTQLIAIGLIALCAVGSLYLLLKERR